MCVVNLIIYTLSLQVTRDLEVASTDEFYGILEQVHSNINHEGLHKTYAAVRYFTASFLFFVFFVVLR